MHRLVCLGLSHRTAPVELRERIGSLGPGAERCPAVLEHVVLQTCYRIELYAHLTSGVDDARDELVDALSTVHDVPRDLLVQHLYVHPGEDADQRALEALVEVGELAGVERFGQRVGELQQDGGPSTALGRARTLLFRTAITAGRRARSGAIGANLVTASSMALALAEESPAFAGEALLVIERAGSRCRR